ncbi:hypothetical protein [Streptomyces exfoliatus]|uniref:hypothetical protein n=1 Tax=Streptomyces exfoliatus TaxID=1905 RepID=UPI003C2B9287
MGGERGGQGSAQRESGRDRVGGEDAGAEPGGGVGRRGEMERVELRPDQGGEERPARRRPMCRGSAPTRRCSDAGVVVGGRVWSGGGKGVGGRERAGRSGRLAKVSCSSVTVSWNRAGRSMSRGSAGPAG